MKRRLVILFFVKNEILSETTKEQSTENRNEGNGRRFLALK